MWTHLALVYDDSRTDDPTQQAIFYVNGQPFTGDATGSRTHGATNVWPNRLAFSGASCTIGCHGTGVAFFDGLIDELKVWAIDSTSGDISAPVATG